jgi:hypothetical protein
MWDKPRTARTEIISVDTDRLAERAFAKTKYAFIRPVPMGDGKILLTLATAADWDGLAGYYWFRDVRDASQFLHKIVAGLNRCADWRLARARARRKGLAPLETVSYLASYTEDGAGILEVADIDAVIEECFKWQWWPPLYIRVTDDEIKRCIVNIKADMDRALVQWQVTGAMKRLNQEYKALRLGRAPGEKIPSFKVWLTAQFEARMLQPVPSSPV